MKRRHVSGNIITGSDSGKEAVHHTHHSLFRRDKATHLRENNRFLVVAARRKLLCTLCMHRSLNAGRNRRTWRQGYAESCSNKRTSFHGYCLLLVTTTEHGGVSTADRRYTSPNIDHRAHLNPTDLVPPGYARL